MAERDTKVLLRCPDCPRAHRVHGAIDFPEGLPSFFLWTFRRGHTFGIRPLNREERRADPNRAHFVATRWELAE